MPFALCPDNGPPRLWRYVEDDVMTSGNIVTLLDAEQNILYINRQLFEQLGELDRHMTLRTQARATYAR